MSQRNHLAQALSLRPELRIDQERQRFWFGRWETWERPLVPTRLRKDGKVVVSDEDCERESRKFRFFAIAHINALIKECMSQEGNRTNQPTLAHLGGGDGREDFGYTKRVAKSHSLTVQVVDFCEPACECLKQKVKTLFIAEPSSVPRPQVILADVEDYLESTFEPIWTCAVYAGRLFHYVDREKLLRCMRLIGGCLRYPHHRFLLIHAFPEDNDISKWNPLVILHPLQDFLVPLSEGAGREVEPVYAPREAPKVQHFHQVWTALEFALKPCA